MELSHANPFKIISHIELGDGKTMPSDSVAAEFNRVLKNVKDGLALK